MLLDRDEIAGDVLAGKLLSAPVGVVVAGMEGIDPSRIASLASASVGRDLRVAVVGYPPPPPVPGLTFASDIEAAVGWRNDPAAAGEIVAFVRREVPKLHSLADLDRFTSREVASRLLDLAEADLADNQPQARFWQALREDASTFPLGMLESFVAAVHADRTNTEGIPANLWRLGLLRDDELLNSNHTPVERLRRNRELLVEMGQLSEASRRRMLAALGSAGPEERTALRDAFQHVTEFYRRGGTDVLRLLDMKTVSRLIEAGRPLAQPAAGGQGPAVQPEDTPPGPEHVRVDRPLRGRELEESVAELVVRTDPEAEQGLRELAEALADRLSGQPSTEGISVTPGFGGRTLLPSPPSRDLREFIGYCCAADHWGGILRTPRSELDDAVRYATRDDVTAYDPESPGQGVLGNSLFELVRRCDTLLDTEALFSGAVERLAQARGRLCEHLDLLLTYPLVLLAGLPEAREALDDYLTAYAHLLALFCQHEATLHGRDSAVARFVTTELLRLDVVHIRTPHEWKALLTPLHPFHLWKFREILGYIRDPRRPMNNQEREQLSDALPDLPHLLHYLVLSGEATDGEIVDLPQAGTIGLLPTYENHTNRYIGADGVHFVADLLKRWLDYAPYARPELRLALVDVPDLPEALRSAADFLKANLSTRLVVEAYCTRRQRIAGDLTGLDYHEHDYELAELLRRERLVVMVHHHVSVAQVAAALELRPVHIAYLFDQSQYQLGYAPRARHLLVSPLVVTYQYDYSETLRRGTIAPSSEAEQGIFSDYHFLAERAARLPAGQQIRLQYQEGGDLEPVNRLLLTGAVRWLALADRVLTAYAPLEAIPLGEQRIGAREVGVWAGVSSRAISRLVDLLRRHNLRPSPDRVAALLRRYGHIAAGGLLSLPPISGGSVSVREAREKGLLGTVLAAAWYVERYPGALVASLDTSLARQWLQARVRTEERADLVGVRLEEDAIIFEPIEVKARADNPEVRVERDEATGQRRLEGRAASQLQAVIATLQPIFGEADEQPLLTPARREVLKYQVFRECFRDVHDPDWQREWFALLQQAFRQPPTATVICRGLILHVQMEQAGSESIRDDDTQPLTLVRLGTAGVQRLVGLGDDPPGDPGADAPPDAPVPPAPEPDVPPIGSPMGGPPPPVEQSPPETLGSSAPPGSIPDVVDEAGEYARLFLRACQAYRIEVDECDPRRAAAGPTVWRFYVRLRRGQRLDPLRSALEDISREMRRSGVLVSPVAHSDEIALDVPRTTREFPPIDRGLTRLGTITSIEQMPITIGVTPEGQDVVRDLSVMPHLLVGGTTGAGKSIFLYGVLASLLTTHPAPASLRLLLCTSKLEDFVFFSELPHLETGRVIDDAAEAVELLQTHIRTAFEERGGLLTAARCRDIVAYNASGNEPLPPLVVMVDEFADLADQLSGNRTGREAFYTNLRRVAQLGRNRGVHLVLCTQRPSADLVPTSIRNLMNARVALRVNDSTASRMILDEPGAEQLQLHGDLLFKEPAALTRAQAYSVSAADVEAIVASIRHR